MKRFSIILIVLLIGAVAYAEVRLWGVEDLRLGTSSRVVEAGTLHDINASYIPLAAGGDNVEARLISLAALAVSLQAQIDALTTALGLKADNTAVYASIGLKADNSILTSELALKADTDDMLAYLTQKASITALMDNLALKANLASPTFTGTVTTNGSFVGVQFESTGLDNTHYVQIGNTGRPTVPATDNGGILHFNTTDNTFEVTNSLGAWGTVAVTFP